MPDKVLWKELDEILREIQRSRELASKEVDPDRQGQRIEALRYWTRRYEERRAELA